METELGDWVTKPWKVYQWNTPAANGKDSAAMHDLVWKSL
jgi:hypothetical protein